MGVKILFPKVPKDQECFLKFIGYYSNSQAAKIIQNKDGSPFCILSVNYADSKVMSANDVIDLITGKIVDETTLKPRIHVDRMLQKDMKPTINDFEIERVNVTHYEEDCYFVQLLSERDRNNVVGECLSTMYEEYRSNMLTALEYNELRVDTLYASIYRLENGFFRIKVLDKPESDKIKVLFVDYGNTEFIEDKAVFELNDTLQDMAPLAYKCTIDNVRIIDERKHDKVSIEVLNRNYNANIMRTKTADGEVRMSIDFLDFASVSYKMFLILENIAIDTDIDHSMVDKEEGRREQHMENGVKENQELVVVTHIESLEELYVQLADSSVEENLLLISTKIDLLTSKLSDKLQFVDNDTIYLSKFSVDGNWYRCKVIENKLENEEPSITVQYIDFGNKEMKYDVKELKPLNKDWHEQATELAEIVPCAKKCTFDKKLLAGLTRNNIDCSYFREVMILPEKIMKLSYHKRTNENDWVVTNIVVDEEEDFIKKYCNDSETELTPVCDYYKLTNMESVSKMWFQLVSTKDEDRQRQINSITKWSGFKIPSDKKPMTTVATDKPYCVVNRLHRVTGRNVNEVLIQHIDTGFYDMVRISSLYSLSKSIESIAPLARAYTLALRFKKNCELDVKNFIRNKLNQMDVELDSLSESIIRDVIINGESLIKSLENEGLKDAFLHCWLSPVNVNLSLSRVERMIQQEVTNEDSKVIFRQKLSNIGDRGIFDRLRIYCQWVTELKVLGGHFFKVQIDRKSKNKEMEPLVERRTKIYKDAIDKYRLISNHVDEEIKMHTTLINCVPILYTFLAKNDDSPLHLIMPEFVHVSTLPDHISSDLDQIFQLFSDMIKQIISMWSKGFIYCDEDIDSGLLLAINYDSSSQASLSPSSLRGCLSMPLPLSSILLRENIPSYSGARSINAYMCKLGALVEQTLHDYLNNHDLHLDDDLMANLVKMISNVTNMRYISDAESVVDELRSCFYDIYLLKNYDVIFHD